MRHARCRRLLRGIQFCIGVDIRWVRVSNWRTRGRPAPTRQFTRPPARRTSERHMMKPVFGWCSATAAPVRPRRNCALKPSSHARELLGWPRGDRARFRSRYALRHDEWRRRGFAKHRWASPAESGRQLRIIRFCGARTAMRLIEKALTFDDMLLLPAYTAVLP